MPLAVTEQYMAEKRFSSTLRKATALAPSRRKQAMADLVFMGPDAMMRLLREYKSLSRRLSIFSVISGLLMQSLNVLRMFMDHTPAMAPWLLVVRTLTFLGLGVLAICDLPMVWRMMCIRRALAAFDDPRVIGPVSELLKKRRYRKSAFWRTRLLHLLSLVNTADPEILRRVDCTHLNAILSTDIHNIPVGQHDLELITAILKAYPYIGDEAAIAKALFLARHSNQAIRTAARDCLPLLKARVATEKERRERERIGADLLRASSNATIAPEILLRAATGTEVAATQQASNQLLRPLETEVCCESNDIDEIVPQEPLPPQNRQLHTSNTPAAQEAAPVTQLSQTV